jgi:translocator assembly and maintenance protein 41
MKYGVIEKRDIIRDLTDWESLYIAGRMQKPTLAITTMTDELIEAQQKNLNAAAAAALLLSPLYSPTIDEDQYKNIQSLTCMALSWPVFFQTITSISYSGDFRMRMGGEDPQKIQKLVQGPGQLSRFYNLYHPSITKMIESGIVSVIDDNPSMSSMQQHTANNLGRLEWNSNDVSARQQLLSQLSRSVQDTVQRHHQHQMQKYESISSPLSLSDKDVAVALANSLAGIVGPTARNQSFKGMFTLGLRKSIRYASAKLSKGLFRKR